MRHEINMLITHMCVWLVSGGSMYIDAYVRHRWKRFQFATANTTFVNERKREQLNPHTHVIVSSNHHNIAMWRLTTRTKYCGPPCCGSAVRARKTTSGRVCPTCRRGRWPMAGTSIVGRSITFDYLCACEGE